MLRLTTYIAILILAGTIVSMAQVSVLGGQRQKLINLANCEFELDSLTIAPNSVSIFNDSIGQVNEFEVKNRSIFLDEAICKALIGSDLMIDYRILPFDIEQEYFHLDSTMMKVEDRAIYIGSDYNFSPKGKEIIDAKGLDYNGSFSRGFSVGNSQSLVLNSNFNLQLAGDLGNKISVIAAISDDNIPIQPEGNTQQIQEFDKVFIKVTRDKTSIIAGDYNLERPRSYFINVFKKLKGLSGQNIYDFGNGKTLESNGSFAISRGKFARQTLDTKEGNQGPYKLTGNAGERFLIVLSGSEKVYLDGKLLKRGLDYDYVIDYNRAEVTFTPNRILGRESRIIIEYEYRDQNYLRSVYSANTYYSTPKIDWNFNFYSEQDSKTATGDIVLDSFDIQQLMFAGDSIQNARISSIRPANDSIFIPGQIRYRLIPGVFPDDSDTLLLEYSADLNDELFAASFLEVGAGNGRYSIDENSLVNGRVYKYVGPGQGLYDPVTSLTPPEKKQVMSFGLKVRPRDNVNISSEVSLSNTDINRFAELGNDNNIGLAGVLNYSHDLHLSKKKKILLSTDNKFEFVDLDYVALNPYRNAEFNRDWNIQNGKIDGRQNLVNSTIVLSVADALSTNYSFKLLDIKGGQNNYKGINQSGGLNYRNKGFELSGKIDFLSSEGFGEKTLFRRPRGEISQVLSKKRTLRIGGGYDGETNKRSSNDESEELLKSSFAFDLFKVFLENAADNKLHYKLQYSSRNDFFPEANNLAKSIVTSEINSSAKWVISPKHGLSFNFGIRDFQVQREDLLPSPNKSKRTLIGRLDHDLNTFSGLVISNTSYLINSGQEPKIEFFFEKVEKGQGDYIYIGNPDSVLINNNFRFAPDLGTGNFIRLSLINNEFITTNNQSLTQSLRLEPKKYFLDKEKKKRASQKEKEKAAAEKNKTQTEEEKKNAAAAAKLKRAVEKAPRSKKKKSKRVEKLLSRFSTISTFRISKKVEDDGTNQQSSFLNFSADDPNLVSYNSLINNTLFVNRGNPAFDFQIGNKITDNVFTQISGREERTNNEYFFRSRIRLMKSADFIMNLKQGKRMYDSEQDERRDLKVDYYSINPEISYRPNSSFRINVLYTYDERDQQIRNQEKATSHDFTLSTTYRQASNANLNFSISYVDVNFNGDANSTIEFDLLQGLKDGKNFIWNALFTKRLSNNIDLNISYEGRRSGDAPTVHIARAQVKASF